MRGHHKWDSTTLARGLSLCWCAGDCRDKCQCTHTTKAQMQQSKHFSCPSNIIKSSGRTNQWQRLWTSTWWTKGILNGLVWHNAKPEHSQLHLNCQLLLNSQSEKVAPQPLVLTRKFIIRTYKWYFTLFLFFPQYNYAYLSNTKYLQCKLLYKVFQRTPYITFQHAYCCNQRGIRDTKRHLEEALRRKAELVLLCANIFY